MNNNNNSRKATTDAKNDFMPNDGESLEYTRAATNRQQAIDVLTRLKAREAATTSLIFWRDRQPTLVESTSETQWEQRISRFNFGRPEMRGMPTTDSCARMPGSWESKMERKRKRAYTLEETPTMAFKASGHLPAHYYMDESAVEAYIESLTKESDNE